MKDVQSLILEAVESGGSLTMPDIREYVNHWWSGEVKPSNHSIGQFAGNLVRAEVLVSDGHRFWLPALKPSTLATANPDHETVSIAPFQRKRSGRLISIEHSPIEVEDVARMEVKIDGRYIPIMLSGDVRVCIGPDIPKWDPAQETLQNVTSLRITTKAGKVEEMNINVQCPVTLAPAP